MSLRNKLFGVALAASMITGAVVPVMAATITIQNAQEGISYDAYKIFDIDHSNELTSPYDGYAYTILETNPWKSAVKKYADSHTNEITLTASAKDENEFVVEIKTGFNPVTFGAHLETYLTKGHENYNGNISASASTTNDNVISVTDAGYYLVHAVDGLNSLAVLVNSTDDKIIVDKNNQSISKTFADNSEQAFVAVGDTVSYKLTSQVPYRPDRALDGYAFTITDTMPAGFDLDITTVAVQIGTGSALDSSAYRVTENKEDHTFTLSLPIDDNSNVGETITITYSGEVVNGFREVTADSNPGNVNTVSGTINEKTISDTATFYTASYQIKKVADDNETALKGAVFTLSITEGNTTKYYSEDNAGNVSWVENPKALDENIAESDGVYRVTPQSGILVFKGLDADKNYTLTEVKAPTGYNLLKEDFTISFKEENETKYTGSVETLVLAEATKIVNYKGVQLPETGGMGTTLFYMVGGTLVAGGTVLLITKKRMSEAE